MATSEFDNFAGNYTSLHDRNIAISGESSDYFVQYKWAHFLRLFPDVPTGKGLTILDYGCGNGRLAIKLAEACPGNVVIGIDSSVESIKQAEMNMRPNLQFMYKDDSDVSLEKNTVDYIIMANVLHHIVPEERPNTISKLKNLLRKNGKLIIYEHNPYNPLTRMAVSRCVFDEHAVLLKLTDAKKLCVMNNMAIFRSGYIVFFPKLLKALRGLEPFLNFLPLGAQYYAVAESGQHFDQSDSK